MLPPQLVPTQRLARICALAPLAALAGGALGAQEAVTFGTSDGSVVSADFYGEATVGSSLLLVRSQRGGVAPSGRTGIEGRRGGFV